MQMVPINSMDILSFGYKDLTLHIRFSSGELYAYYNVPASIYNGFKSASSHSKYFHTNIKGRYADTRIG